MLFLISSGFANESEKILYADFSEEKVKIDGVLADEIYKKLIPIEDFIQYHPKNGELPSFKTQVYCWYDKYNIFISFNCIDPDKNQIAADLTPFGQFENNDYMTVYIDTYNDKQTYETFSVNPKGVRAGKETVWEANAKINEGGWCGEIKIPFKSLRFPVKDIQQWAINFERFIYRLNETIYWTKVERKDLSVFGDTFGSLENIEKIKGGKNIELFPYAGIRNSSFDEGNETKIAYGLDLKYGITSNLTMDLTSSPDYSDVESDPFFYQLTPYEVNLQDKRPFFLEGSSNFSSIFNLFYSRRISNPELALKLSGKERGFTLGFLAANNNTQQHDQFYGVFRLQKDVFSMSKVGFTYSDKEEEGDWNRNFGFDINLTLKNSFKISTMTAFSYNKNISNSRNGMYYFDLSRYVDRGFSFDLNYKRFEPEVYVPAGYITQVDYEYFSALLRYILRYEGHWLEKISFEFQKTHSNTLLQELRSFDLNNFKVQFSTSNQIYFSIFYKFGKYRPQILDDNSDLIWNPQIFNLNVAYLTLDYYGSQFINFNAFCRFQKTPVYNDSYTLALPGSSRDIELSSTLKFSPQLQLNVDFTNTHYHSNNNQIDFTGNLISCSLIYQISKKLAGYVKFQHDSYEKRFQYDLFLGYELGALSKIYFSIKNFSHNEFRLFNPEARSMTFKISYLLRL